ncbi:MAG: EamA family transporter [Actinobacteria bacterium]|nr:EamA family transporter [Actinomycetota bacterium]
MTTAADRQGGHVLGVFAVTSAALLWGTTGTAATFAPNAGPLAIGAAALGVGGLLQALIAPRALRRAAPALRARAGVVLVGALSVAVYPLAFYSAMHLAGVAVGTVVSLASAPLAAGLMERVLDRRRLGVRWWIAAALGIAGSVLLCAARLGDAHGDAAATLWGVLLGLVAGAAYAAYSWAAAALMTGGVPRAAAMGSVFGLGGLLLMPVLLITGAPLVASGSAFAVAAYMALVPMFLGYVLFGLGLARVGAGAATTITLLEPAAATVLAVLVVGERLTAAGWAGLALIGAAVVLLSIRPATPVGVAGGPV